MNSNSEEESILFQKKLILPNFDATNQDILKRYINSNRTNKQTNKKQRAKIVASGNL